MFYYFKLMIYNIKHHNIYKKTSSKTFNCNCSYQHVNLFKEYDDKFDMFINVCWIGMFKVELIV
jgi:hypothetical protein